MCFESPVASIPHASGKQKGLRHPAGSGGERTLAGHPGAVKSRAGIPPACCFSLSELCAYPLRETPIAEASNCGLTNRLFFIFSVRARSVSSRLTFRILG